MPASAPARRPAHTPEELHTVIAHAVNDGDLEAFTDAHDDDATVVVLPEGRTVHGRDDIQAAVAPLFELHPRMTVLVLEKLETDGLALAHGRWQLVVTENGHLEDRARRSPDLRLSPTSLDDVTSWPAGRAGVPADQGVGSCFIRGAQWRVDSLMW